MKYTQALLDYNKIDEEIFKAEKEFFGSPKMKLAQNMKAEREKSDLDLESVVKRAQAINKDIEKLEAEITSIAVEKPHITGSPDLGALDGIEKPYIQLAERLEKSATTIKRMVDELNGLQKSAEDIDKKINQLNTNIVAMDTECRGIRNALIVKFDASRKQLEALRPKIAPNVMEVYLRTRKTAQRLPLIGKYLAPNCLACGMDIGADVGRQLKEPDDITVCPNCGRLIYAFKK